MRSKKEQFVITYYPFAKKASEKTGIPVLFALAQSALESGWGKSAKGNMMFGVKKGSGRNYGGWSAGQSQLITTTEYSSSPHSSFPFIYPGYPIQTSSGKWKYRIKDLFRAYPNPFFSFLDWAGLLFKNNRYSGALRYRKDPYRFADEIAQAGYATDPNYASKVKTIMREIEGIIISNKLDQKKPSWVVPYVIVSISVLLITGAIVNSRIKK